MAKLNLAGGGAGDLMWSTFLGGTAEDRGVAIALDGAGNAYVTGRTSSADFPTANPMYAARNGFAADAFVSEISADGSTLLYSTYLGGMSPDEGRAIVVASTGHIYVAGQTLKNPVANLPTTPGAFEELHSGGNPAAPNYDIFVSKFLPDGSPLVFSTLLGGVSNDFCNGLALDGFDNPYVVGRTSSTDVPLSADAIDSTYAANDPADAVLAKFNAEGSALVYGSYLGGTAEDTGYALAVDGAGNAYVSGLTRSADFPTSAGAFDVALDGASDAFLMLQQRLCRRELRRRRRAGRPG